MTKSATFKLVAHYQDRENYGAHDWDGTGECPEYWKMKGGPDIVVADGLTAEMVADMAALAELVAPIVRSHECFNNYYESWCIGLSAVLSTALDWYEASEAVYFGAWEWIKAHPGSEVHLEEFEIEAMEKALAEPVVEAEIAEVEKWEKYEELAEAHGY